MTAGLLTFHDAQGAYRALGQPMQVLDQGRLLGTLDPLAVSNHDTEAHVGRFLPTALVRGTQRNFGPLILLEATRFLVRTFDSVQVVHYRLHREIETYGDGEKVALARAQLLLLIGAYDIHVTPAPDALRAGNFMVSGSWSYSQRNLAALDDMLARQQRIYAAGEPLPTPKAPRKGFPWLGSR